MENIKYAALFGGAGRNTASKEYKETIRIGELLAKEGYVVKNGGYGGMMEAVSQGAAEAGGEAIGITCKQIGRTKGNSYLTETIVTDTLYERLQLLIEESSLFVVQKGGVGTLSEVFLTLDILRKNRALDKPRLFFIGEVWKDIISELKRSLIPAKEHHLFEVVEDYETFKECILN